MTAVPTVSTPGKSILFALDESDHSIAALHWTFEYIVKSPEDKLTCAIVITKEDDRDATLSRVKTLLRATYQSTLVDVKLAVKILQGSPKEAGKLLCNLVEETEPDVMVLGSAGKSHMEGFLVGSTSSYCVANAKCPVIVARLTSADERGRLDASKERRRSKSPFFVM
ncbi:hypothetical protein HDU96_004335 [Phlyctochytrium bullatum]|nr:hypothetical protein HDU96_004335 [Phlyctochytrium bullatum]